MDKKTEPETPGALFICDGCWRRRTSLWDTKVSPNFKKTTLRYEIFQAVIGKMSRFASGEAAFGTFVFWSLEVWRRTFENEFSDCIQVDRFIVISIHGFFDYNVKNDVILYPQVGFLAAQVSSNQMDCRLDEVLEHLDTSNRKATHKMSPNRSKSKPGRL